MLLRTMCISGSVMSSTTLRSSSVSSPVHHELDLLARLLAQVAHQARHLLEGLADRHHAHRHRVALQVAGDAASAAPGCAPRRSSTTRDSAGSSLNERLRDDQLADHVDQAVELPRIDLDRRALVAAAAVTAFRAGRDGAGTVRRADAIGVSARTSRRARRSACRPTRSARAAAAARSVPAWPASARRRRGSSASGRRPT